MRRFTSDLHLGSLQVAHWRFGKWEGNVAHHDRIVTATWDAVVAEEDEVFIVGDLIGEYDYKALSDWLDERPGIKHLIKGNNDVGMDFHALPLATVSDCITMNLGPWRTPTSVTLSHYPTHQTTADVLIHGHTHRKNDRGGWLDEAGGQVRVHVGWDAWRSIPSEHEVLAFIEAVRHDAV